LRLGAPCGNPGGPGWRSRDEGLLGRCGHGHGGTRRVLWLGGGTDGAAGAFDQRADRRRRSQAGSRATRGAGQRQRGRSERADAWSRQSHCLGKVDRPAPEEKGSRAAQPEDASFEISDNKALFDIRPFKPSTTKEELACFAYDTKLMLDEAKNMLAAMERQRYEQLLREKVLEERERSVQKLLDKIALEMQKLEDKRKRFESDITIFKRDEKKNIKARAANLDAMDPKIVAELLLEYGAQNEDLAVKLLVSMDPEIAAKVLEAIDRKEGANLILKATRLIDEEG
jgi:hypothetical protein